MAVETRIRARPHFDGLAIQFGGTSKGGMIWQTIEKDSRE
jgi:hypothetical protein